MTKQEYLLSVIDAIPDREMGWGLKTLIQNNQVEETTLDKLVVIFERAVSRITNTVKNGRMVESVQQSQQDRQDVQNLESAFSSF